MKIIHMILGAIHTNSYILYDETTRDAVVIDPACYGDKIAKEIGKNNLNVKYIIITHAHSDHFEALDEIKEKTGAAFCVSKIDEKILCDADANMCNFFRKSLPKTKADVLIDDSDTLKLANHTLKFFMTPGHTKGGMCILCENMLFSGDTLFFEAIGRTDFPGGDMTEIMDSIKYRLFTLPDNTIVYPGHGEQTTIAHEKKHNPYVW